MYTDTHTHTTQHFARDSNGAHHISIFLFSMFEQSPWERRADTNIPANCVERHTAAPSSLLRKSFMLVKMRTHCHLHGNDGLLCCVYPKYQRPIWLKIQLRWECAAFGIRNHRCAFVVLWHLGHTNANLVGGSIVRYINTADQLLRAYETTGLWRMELYI